MDKHAANGQDWLTKDTNMTRAKALYFRELTPNFFNSGHSDWLDL
jgi:hypothetical protein